LPNAPDTDSILNDKDDFAKFILNQVLAGLGYDPIGLDNNLPIAAGTINATLLQGDYFVSHDYGWTDFNIDATTGELLVTTYGIPGYTDADLSGNPAAVLALNPAIVSQFEVTPTSDSIIGTARNDDLRGTNNADVILGAAGNDDLQGRDGDDYLDGGKGNDDVRGGAGNDRIFGRDGNDRLDGQDGDDLIDGGQGNDKLNGGAGSDTLTGGLGDDELSGGGSDDLFVFNVGDSNGPKHDIIKNFNTSPLEHDVIELRGWAAYGVTDFASLQSHMFKKGSDVWIVGDGTAQHPTAGTDIIVLDHTKLADLHISDFLLV
jgi:3-phytase/alkaline phosphatase D